MTTTPYAVAQISVSGAAVQQGGLTVAGGATIQLSGTNTSNWRSARWEIYAYPSGWATPSGWTLDAATGIIYSTDTTPTLITLEAASARWGKWLVRLIVNGGTKNGVPPTTDPITGSYLPNDVIDIASGWQVLSPNYSLVEPALFEGTQFGGLKRWQAAIAASLRLIDAITGGGTVTVYDAAMHDANYAVAETSGDVSVGSDTAFTLDRTLTLKSAASVGMRVTWYDEAVTTPSLNAHNLVVALDGAGNIQRRNANAATLTLGLGDLGGGGSITFEKVSATLWKALS